MKICLINNLFTPYNRGGADRIVSILKSGLEEAGHSVFVITTKPKGEALDKSKYPDHYLDSYFSRLAQIPLFLRFFWHVYDMFDLFTAKKVKAILKAELPDLVVTHNLKGLSLLIPRAIKSLGIKHAHVLHDIQLLHPSGLMFLGQEAGINSFLARLYSRVNRLLFASVGIVISPSSWLLTIHEKNGFFAKAKKAVIPNPVSIPTPQAKKESGVFTFTYIGELVAHKGVQVLLESFEKLDDRNTRLVIMGAGPLLEKLKSENNERVEFKGFTEANLAKRIIGESQCLVMPSYCYENSPTAIYDALSVATPVIASRLGGAAGAPTGRRPR